MNINCFNAALKAFYILCSVFLCADIYVFLHGTYPVCNDIYSKQIVENCEVLDDTGWSVNTDSKGIYTDDEDPSVRFLMWNKGMRPCRRIFNKKSKLKAAVLGCSYTFGVGVKSEDTMVWRLNDKYPDVSFDNYGVSGWGPVQMQAKLKHLLKNDKYDLVVYNAIFDHLFRNYVPRAVGNLKNNDIYAPVPYASENCFNIFTFHYFKDLEWPFEYNSCACSFIKRIYYSRKTKEFEKKYRQDAYIAGHDQKIKQKAENSYAEAVNSMYDICSAAGTDFVVVDLEDYPDSILHNDRIRAEVILADMPDGKAHDACNRVLNNPEFHPNKKVHKYWADRFSEWFDERYEKRLKNMAVR